jgi:phage terminase large subunit-like protein
VNPDDLEGRECYAGLDLASTMDLCSLVLLFPDGPGYQILPYYWVPETAVRKRVRDGRTPIDAWAASGHIDVTPGDVLDYDRVRARINELSQKYNMRELAIDRWNATQLAVQLQGDGVNVVMFGQGYQSMSAPTKEMEKLILAGKVAHGGHPVLRWNVSNVTIEQDAAGNQKPSKKKSAENIDGVVATIMALGRAMLAVEETTGGVEVW